MKLWFLSTQQQQLVATHKGFKTSLENRLGFCCHGGSQPLLYYLTRSVQFMQYNFMQYNIRQQQQQEPTCNFAGFTKIASTRRVPTLTNQLRGKW